MESETPDQAYAALFDAHYEAALRLAFLLTGNRSESEETVAEAFAVVYPRWRAGRVEKFVPYLKTVVTNEVRRQYRTRRAHSDHAERVPVAGSGGGMAEDIAERSALFQALLRLPVRQRAAIVLRYYDDLSEACTAEVLGTSIGTVKSQVSRGLARLQVLLTETTEGK